MDCFKRYPTYTNGRFSNFEGERPEGVFWRSMIMFMQSWLKRRKATLDKSAWIYEKISPRMQAVPDSIEWVGHASFLITIQGTRIITDPVFGDLFLFPRILPAAYTVKQPPFVDVVLISHNHMDHMDSSSIIALKSIFPDV